MLYWAPLAMDSVCFQVPHVPAHHQRHFREVSQIVFEYDTFLKQTNNTLSKNTKGKKNTKTHPVFKKTIKPEFFTSSTYNVEYHRYIGVTKQILVLLSGDVCPFSGTLGLEPFFAEEP